MRRFLQSICIQVLIAAALVLPPAYLHAETLYSDRPHISNVAAKKDAKRDRIMSAYLNFLIELYAFYPRQQRVHLARDGETLYDMDFLIASKLPKLSEPLLLNVSRNSMHSNRILDYLRTNGLSPENIDVQNPPMLIDTGYEGSIIDFINERLSRFKTRVRGHLISSAHSEIPSSRIVTQVFYRGQVNARKLESYLNAVDETVELIENLPHYTASASGYKKVGGRWEAVSSEENDEDEQESAERLMQAVREYVERPETLRRIEILLPALESLLQLLKGSVALVPAEIQQKAALFKEQEYDLIWADIREAFGKKTLVLNPARMQELWKILGKPNLLDLEDALDHFESEERKLLKSVTSAPQAASNGLLIEEILKFHKEAQSSSRVREYQAVSNAIESEMRDGVVQIPGLGTLKVGRLLGEGYRGNVYELGTDYALKVSIYSSDLRYMEVEAKVAAYIAAHDEFGIKTLPIVAYGADGAYIVRRRFNKNQLGSEILNKGLSPLQMQKLEQLFQNVRRFAAQTGVGLDIKSDNLIWQDNDWVVFDLGPRTSYGPYAFSLGPKSFAEFLELWNEEDPEGRKLSIQTVVGKIRRGDCNSLLELKP